MSKEEKEEGPESARRPYLKFWYHKWRTDAYVRSLSFAERGVYIEILACNAEDLEIPGDPDSVSTPSELRQYLVSVSSGFGKVAVRTLNSMWSELRQHFTKTKPGFMCNNRLFKDLKEWRGSCSARVLKESRVDERRGEKMFPPLPPLKGERKDVASQVKTEETKIEEPISKEHQAEIDRILKQVVENTNGRRRDVDR